MPIIVSIKIRKLFVAAAVLLAAHSLHAGQSPGTIQGWGSNFYGQLGNADRLTPHPSLIDNVTRIAAGGTHALALQMDGTVKAWGKNDFGQLGIGSTQSTSVPVTVSILVNVTALACGGNHSLALRSDGTVWAWGKNSSGQLGNGTTTDSLVPAPVPGLSGVKAIAAGFEHSLVLKTDGTVLSFGNNDSGQLGDGTFVSNSSPVQVSGLTGITAIACGNLHSIVVKSSDTVWTFGNNNRGQLGNGTQDKSNTPVQVTDITGASLVAGGGSGGISGLDHSIVLKGDGTVWAFGSNSFGELGDGNASFLAFNATPVQVSGLTGITAIATGQFQCLALKSDNTVFAWGDNRFGQLGDGTTTDKFTPVQVTALSNVAAIACGLTHSIALLTDGTVQAWGSNDLGELGNGTAAGSSDPIPAQGISDIKAVACGAFYSTLLKADGSVWAFGYNADAELGNGTTASSFVPVQVTGLSNVVAISSFSINSLALKDDGTVWAWGSNTFGQLGIGSSLPSLVPVQVSNLSGVKAIACGGNFSLALKTDGTVWGWGGNLFDELGVAKKVGFTIDHPIQIAKLANIKAIACGAKHSLVLTANGTIMAFGNNAYGQLGTGSTKAVKGPTLIKNLKNVVSIACGGNHSMAIDNKGILFSWGANESGQLGNNKFVDSALPVRTLIDGTITALAGGDKHTLALRDDGTIWSWGLNTSGQLGRSDSLQVFNQSLVFSVISPVVVSPVPRRVTNISGATGIAAGSGHSLGLVDSATFPETFLNPAAVLEQQPAGTQFGFFKTTDPSVQQRTFTYALVPGIGSTDNASFTIFGSSLLTATVFDFEAKDTYVIRVRTTDNLGAFVEKPFLIDILGLPNSGAEGVPNIAFGNSATGTVVNPINDLAITVARSDGGVISLLITLTQGDTELEATTEFDDIPGKQKTKIGFTPSHRYTQKGIYVAKVTVREKVSGNVVAMGRKMINIDQTETGAVTLNAFGEPRFLSPPPSRNINVGTMKGTFYFNANKTDTVKYVGTFVMPPGLNTKQTNGFSFGIGNVILDMSVDASGKLSPLAGTSHEANNPDFSKLSLKVAKLPKDGVTKGGELATFSTLVAANALSQSGFDSEGITNTPTRDNSTERRIQVSYNLSGIAYEDSAVVKYVLSPTRDFGAFERQR